MIRRLCIALAVMLAVSLNSADASTSMVSASAKPWMILGGLAAGVTFLSLGFVYLRRGASRRQMAARSLQWPVIEGRIVSASVKTEMRSDGEGSKSAVYTPEARYSYAVAGKAYEGNVIRLGLEQFGYAAAAPAQKHIEPYAAGSPVPVHFDPDDPSLAVLELGESGAMRNLVAGSLFFLVGAFGLVFVVWTTSLGTY